MGRVKAFFGRMARRIRKEKKVVVPQAEYPKFFGINPAAFEGAIVRPEKLSRNEIDKLLHAGFRWGTEGERIARKRILVTGQDVLKVSESVYKERMRK